MEEEQKETQNPKQAPGSRLQALGSRLRAVSIEPDTGLESTNCEIMT